MELCCLAAERCDTHRVLEQAAGVAMVALCPGRRQEPHALLDLAVREDRPDQGGQRRMRDLCGEKLEESLQLVRVAADRRGERRRICLRGLHGPHGELKSSVEPFDAAEHAHGIALRETAVEKLDVIPDATFDPAARVDELEREVGLAAAGREPALARDRVDAVDGAVLHQLGDRRHGVSVGSGGGRRPPVPRRPVRAADRGGNGSSVRRDRRRRARRAACEGPAQRRTPDLGAGG